MGCFARRWFLVVIVFLEFSPPWLSWYHQLVLAVTCLKLHQLSVINECFFLIDPKLLFPLSPSHEIIFAQRVLSVLNYFAQESVVAWF